MGLSVIRILEAIIGGIVAGLIILFVGDIIHNPTIVEKLEQYSISSNLLLFGIIISAIILAIILIIQFTKNRRGGFSGASANRAQSYVHYVHLGEMLYENVLWEILQPMRNNIQSSEIIVRLKPRCPKCRT
ncbi:MAG: hypothetical protein WCC52_06795, partial [Nitrosotalea sp.]